MPGLALRSGRACCWANASGTNTNGANSSAAASNEASANQGLLQQPDSQTAPPPADSATLDQQIVTAKEFYSNAIDAESRNDYRTAVTYFEYIEKLPREAWPSDTQIRLDFARQQAK